MTAVQAQTTYIPLHSPEEHLLDRLETKSGELSSFFFGIRSISRKDAMSFIEQQKTKILHGEMSLTTIDEYDISRAASINSEWVQTADGMDAAIPSKKPILKYFYEVQPDLIHVHNDNFFLAVNPVFYIEGQKENNQKDIGYINARGIEARGRIMNKIGFYTMFADNQERPFTYVRNYEQRTHTFPGVSSYNRSPNDNYNMLMARGYIDAAFFKDYLNVTLGYDRNFSGVGIRSLVISDFSPPATFLRLRTHWKRFFYQSLFLKLTTDFNYQSDQLLPQKYAAIHQLGFRAFHWLNIGLFEASMFGEADQLKATDLIPVIGYQSLAQALEAEQQKTALGLWFKAISLQHLQFYGQAFFDKLSLSEIGKKGYWGNQLGFQLGAKYFDAFGLPNLDLQGEINVVRPFTYAGSGDNTDYTHRSQPLAHPYGAGFGEIIGNIRYQPLKKLYLTAKGIFSIRGTDMDSTQNNGVNILKNEDQRSSEFGYGLLPDSNRQGIYLNLNIAYEIRPNLFFEVGFTRWDWKYQQTLSHSTGLYGGLRWNISRKEYDSY